jgi:hypothetical protein
MNEYKIVYRTHTGHSDYFCEAESVEQAEDIFMADTGHIISSILGVYEKQWVGVG